MNERQQTSSTEIEHDQCVLPLVQRMLAVLDRDPFSLCEGDPLPHGWHALLFNPPTLQSKLRQDGAARSRVNVPDLGLPRLMFAGQRCEFPGEIPIGAKVRQETRRLGDIEMKQGKSGRFALMTFEQRIYVENENAPAVIQHRDYVLREAAGPATTHASTPPPAAPQASASSIDQTHLMRTIVPDEMMNFRYSAVTDNPHRIHYDYEYTTKVERYPGLVVSGGIPMAFLLEVFRAAAAREPAAFSVRNLAPMFCGRALHLFAHNIGETWRLWIQDDTGKTTVEASAS